MARHELNELVGELTDQLEDLGLDELAEKLQEMAVRLMHEGLEG